jgi:hypothetical protein
MTKEALQAISQEGAEAKLQIIRGGLREIENLEAKILQLEKRDS